MSEDRDCGNACTYVRFRHRSIARKEGGIIDKKLAQSLRLDTRIRMMMKTGLIPIIIKLNSLIFDRATKFDIMNISLLSDLFSRNVSVKLKLS